MTGHYSLVQIGDLLLYHYSLEDRLMGYGVYYKPPVLTVALMLQCCVLLSVPLYIVAG